MTALIQARHLVKRFGDILAVDDVSLSVHRGEVLGFLGPNGAGKTTTMRMITGYLPMTSGEVTICGIGLAERPIEAKARIGYLPEGAPLYPDMTPRQLLFFSGRARGMSRQRTAQHIDFMAEVLHLAPVLDRAIDTLSKGFKRRVGLGLALLHDPEVLILDEPTDGLDPLQKHEVREMIRKMAHEKAIVISTHILEEVESICSRALIIARGKVVADGTPKGLLQHAGQASLDTYFRKVAASGAEVEA